MHLCGKGEQGRGAGSPGRGAPVPRRQLGGAHKGTAWGLLLRDWEPRKLRFSPPRLPQSRAFFLSAA